jgi:diketogulonate reductase-like aldo/keto reductase
MMTRLAKPTSQENDIAYKIVKKKIDQGCKFISKGIVYAQELKDEIAQAIANARERIGHDTY